MWFLKRFDTNQPVPSQKNARSLKIWIQVEEELYYLCIEKALISFADTVKLVCATIFAYTDYWFSD